MNSKFYIALIIGIILGAGWGIVAGRWIDRDRDKYAPAIVEYFDMRSSTYDVESETTFVQPRYPRKDPEGKP